MYSEDRIKAELDNEKARRIDDSAVDSVRNFYQDNV